MGRIHVSSFDFDGCVGNRSYAAMRKKMSDEEAIVKANQALADKIKQGQEEEGYDRTVVLVGSNRQSRSVDEHNGHTKGNGSCYVPIEALAKELGAEFDPFLLSDLYLPDSVAPDKRFGHTHNTIVDPDAMPNAPEATAIYDLTKVSILYAQMQKLALDNPDDEIEFDFYEDNPIILRALNQFYMKHPQLIPNNVTLRCHYYGNLSKVSDEPMDGDALFFSKDKTDRQQVIQGTGKADKNFDKSTVKMCQAAEAKEEDTAKKENRPKDANEISVDKLTDEELEACLRHEAKPIDKVHLTFEGSFTNITENEKNPKYKLNVKADKETLEALALYIDEFNDFEYSDSNPGCVDLGNGEWALKFSGSKCEAILNDGAFLEFLSGALQKYGMANIDTTENIKQKDELPREWVKLFDDLSIVIFNMAFNQHSSPMKNADLVFDTLVKEYPNSASLLKELYLSAEGDLTNKLLAQLKDPSFDGTVVTQHSSDEFIDSLKKCISQSCQYNSLNDFAEKCPSLARVKFPINIIGVAQFESKEEFRAYLVDEAARNFDSIKPIAEKFALTAGDKEDLINGIDDKEINSSSLPIRYKDEGQTKYLYTLTDLVSFARENDVKLYMPKSEVYVGFQGMSLESAILKYVELVQESAACKDEGKKAIFERQAEALETKIMETPLGKELMMKAKTMAAASQQAESKPKQADDSSPQPPSSYRQ